MFGDFRRFDTLTRPQPAIYKPADLATSEFFADKVNTDGTIARDDSVDSAATWDADESRRLITCELLPADVALIQPAYSQRFANIVMALQAVSLKMQEGLSTPDFILADRATSRASHIYKEGGVIVMSCTAALYKENLIRETDPASAPTLCLTSAQYYFDPTARDFKLRHFTITPTIEGEDFVRDLTKAMPTEASVVADDTTVQTCCTWFRELFSSESQIENRHRRDTSRTPLVNNTTPQIQ